MAKYPWTQEKYISSEIKMNYFPSYLFSQLSVPTTTSKADVSDCPAPRGQLKCLTNSEQFITNDIFR